MNKMDVIKYFNVYDGQLIVENDSYVIPVVGHSLYFNGRFGKVIDVLHVITDENKHIEVSIEFETEVK